MHASGRPDLATVGAIAIVAYAACDEIHEVLGHGSIALLTPGVHWAALSTIALSTQGGSRLIAAGGPLVNLLTGLLAMLLFKRRKPFDATGFFLWLFATISLLNATGYLAYSGVLDFGDWAQVIAGLPPHAAWRIAMVVAGLLGYGWTIRWAADALVPRIVAGTLPRPDVAWLILVSYLAGGLLLSAGAALNPLGLKLALLTGVAGSFGAMLGLFLVTPRAERAARSPAEHAAHAASLPRSPGWIVAAAITAAIFLGVLGPGIRFAG